MLKEGVKKLKIFLKFHSILLYYTKHYYYCIF